MDPRQTHKVALSFDIEDWFQVYNFRDKIPFQKWQSCQSRVEEGTHYILLLLEKYQIKATFFILGWIAERAPGLIKQIHSYGHEIATHGYSHQHLKNHTRKSFRKDVEKSMNIISRHGSGQILGYRAPSFSITEDRLWVFRILRDLGIIYDSSLFDTKHPDYGFTNAPTQIQYFQNIIEVPIPVSKFLLFKFPCPGGGYFRVMPNLLIEALLEYQLSNGHSLVYFHPWEFDSHQPRVKLPLQRYFRHYVGLNSNRQKFKRLIKKFRFTTIREILEDKGFVNQTKPTVV